MAEFAHRRPLEGIELTPLVSICLPTYNGAAFLADALASVLAQTYRPLELVVSDSGSTDATLDILHNAALGPHGVHLRLASDTTPGMVKNWNAACRHATGKYIKFLFQDDLLAPAAIEKMVAVAESDPRISFVFCRRRAIIHPGSENHPVTQYVTQCCTREEWRFPGLQPTQDGWALLASSTLLDTPLNKIGEPTCVLVRRDALLAADGFNDAMRQMVDLDMWLRLMNAGAVGYVDEELAAFRLHPSQASVGNAGTAADASDFRLICAWLAQPVIYPRLHRRVRAKIRRYIAEYNDLPAPHASFEDHAYDVLSRTKRLLTPRVK